MFESYWQTESPTLFLQQLGRGLRRSNGKTFCTVLDFVGTHRREFRFDRRYRALIGGTRRDIERAVQQGFPFLPAGCYMQLDQKASKIVLRSLREAIPTRWPARIEELRVVHASYPDVTLSKYLAESGLDLPDVYDGSRCWSDLCEAAGVPIKPAGEHEKPLRKALGRLLHIDDDERIATYRWSRCDRRLWLGLREARLIRWRGSTRGCLDELGRLNDFHPGGPEPSPRFALRLRQDPHAPKTARLSSPPRRASSSSVCRGCGYRPPSPPRIRHCALQPCGAVGTHARNSHRRTPRPSPG